MYVRLPSSYALAQESRPGFPPTNPTLSYYILAGDGAGVTYSTPYHMRAYSPGSGGENLSFRVLDPFGETYIVVAHGKKETKAVKERKAGESNKTVGKNRPGKYKKRLRDKIGPTV